MSVCKFFSSKAGCKRGDQCHFPHIQPATQDVVPAISPPTRIPSWRPTDSSVTGSIGTPSFGFSSPMNEVDCRFFNVGSCKYGDSCRFRHNASKQEEISQEAVIQQARSHRQGQSLANKARTYHIEALRRPSSQILEILVGLSSDLALVETSSVSNQLPPRLLVYRCATLVAPGTNPRKPLLSNSPHHNQWRKLLINWVTLRF